MHDRRPGRMAFHHQRHVAHAAQRLHSVVEHLLGRLGVHQRRRRRLRRLSRLEVKSQELQPLLLEAMD